MALEGAPSAARYEVAWDPLLTKASDLRTDRRRAADENGPRKRPLQAVLSPHITVATPFLRAHESGSNV
jgi:hypothetical protein